MDTRSILLSFVNGLGWQWTATFFVVAVVWLTAFLHLMKHGLAPGEEVLRRYKPRAKASDDGQTPLAVWNELQTHKARIEGMQDLVEKVTALFPVIGLLGTVIGFLRAMVFVGQGVLGSSDSLALLNGLLANGVSESLATTVVGQALYFLFSAFYTMKTARLTEVVSGLSDSMSYVLSRLPRVDSGSAIGGHEPPRA